MISEIKQKLCKHKYYIILQCNKQDNYYICRCSSCGITINKPKAPGEMYYNNINDIKK